MNRIDHIGGTVENPCITDADTMMRKDSALVGIRHVGYGIAMLLKALLAYRKAMVFAFLLWFVASSAMADRGSFSPGDKDEFLDASDVLKLDDIRRGASGFTVQGHIAEGYYVYSHSLKLVDSQGQVVVLELPHGTPKHDDFFGDTEIFTGDTLQVRFSSLAPGPLTLHWQGCAEAGICYPPQTINLAWPVALAGAPSSRAVSPQGMGDGPGSLPRSAADTALPLVGNQKPTAGSRGDGAKPFAVSPGPAIAEDQATAQRLAILGPVMGTLLFFGLGLLLAFTPCTLPMIPIVSTMVVGNQVKPRRAFVLTLAYVLVMATVYAGLGVAAGLAGANLQATLQSPWLLGAFAGLFVVLACSLFGMFELRLPAALVNRVDSAGRGQSGGSVGGAIVLGLLSALLVGPCMTAPLAGALLYIGQSGSALQGGLALFALGLGMGLPLLVIAVFGAHVLPKPGIWMDRVRVVFGYVMMGMAIMMLARFLPGMFSLLLWGAWSLALAVGFVAWAQVVVARQRQAWTLRFFAAFVGLWSILMLVGAASGASSVLQPLAHLRNAAFPTSTASSVSYIAVKTIEDVDKRLDEAAERGQWTLIDFYAEWCISCHVIERNVFDNAEVARRLAGMQVVRPDVTHNDVIDRALLKRWGVMGPPTLILVGPDGAERRNLRMVGEVSVREFMAQLDTAGIP
ncbi:protein-disulfide reductase DsbD [Methylobacillus sp.]|uniref:protein-disulfide reductase DsbD n=1 Tax=Methylobacillus sp. TaxID=56818 RepID=UPI002FDFE11D